jgi:hypothetical protein
MDYRLFEGRWLRALPAAVFAAFGDFGFAKVFPAAFAAFALVTFDFATVSPQLFAPAHPEPSP